MTAVAEYLSHHVMANMSLPRHASMREKNLALWGETYGEKTAAEIVKSVEAAWSKKGLPGAPFPFAGLLSKTANTGEANAHLSR
jgi:hypothetical protein